MIKRFKLCFDLKCIIITALIFYIIVSTIAFIISLSHYRERLGNCRDDFKAFNAELVRTQSEDNIRALEAQRQEVLQEIKSIKEGRKDEQQD